MPEHHDALETVLVHCWESALRLPSVGAHDDFFALGGHSLAAMRIAHRLRSALSVEMDYLLVLECRTIAALARSLRGSDGSAADLDGAAHAYLRTVGRAP